MCSCWQEDRGGTATASCQAGMGDRVQAGPAAMQEKASKLTHLPMQAGRGACLKLCARTAFSKPFPMLPQLKQTSHAAPLPQSLVAVALNHLKIAR